MARVEDRFLSDLNQEGASVIAVAGIQRLDRQSVILVGLIRIGKQDLLQRFLFDDVIVEETETELLVFDVVVGYDVIDVVVFGTPVEDVLIVVVGDRTGYKNKQRFILADLWHFPLGVVEYQRRILSLNQNAVLIYICNLHRSY